MHRGALGFVVVGGCVAPLLASGSATARSGSCPPQLERRPVLVQTSNQRGAALVVYFLARCAPDRVNEATIAFRPIRVTKTGQRTVWDGPDYRGGVRPLRPGRKYAVGFRACNSGDCVTRTWRLRLRPLGTAEQ